MPAEGDVDKKRQMRWAQDERRREKKKQSKEAEIEESKKLKETAARISEHQQLQQSTYQQSSLVGYEPSVAISGSVGEP